MKFRLNRQYGALNSGPIFDAVEQGIKKIGHTTTNSDPDIEIIWSVLWHGRMAGNQMIYERSRQTGKPVMIIEVGNLMRGKTWRISLDHIHGLGKFGNDTDLDQHRIKFLDVDLKKPKENRRKEILIACQHQRSLQWEGQPKLIQWLDRTVREIRNYTDRPIIVRPHPRSPLQGIPNGVKIETPIKVQNTYDDFNLNYDYHGIVNHNSGVAVSAAIQGIPVITDPTSLAYPVSDIIKHIGDPKLPDREEWFLKLCHTEWLVEEIRQGTPFLRLMPELEKFNFS